MLVNRNIYNNNYSRDNVFMLSALPNLFFIKCANSRGFDITVLKQSHDICDNKEYNKIKS